MRSKIFRQVRQKIEVRLTPCRDFFGQHDGTIFKQGVRRKLCGVALNLFFTAYKLLFFTFAKLFDIISIIIQVILLRYYDEI